MAAISRRALLKGLSALAVGSAAGVVTHGVVWERHHVQLVRTDLPLAGLPPGLEGLRLGFVTDLHHSAFVGRDDIERALALVQAESPDVLIYGGDYVSYADRRYAEPVAEILAGGRAPHGVFAILGNHDDDVYVPASLDRRGIAVLRDERTTLRIRGEALTLAGIRFWTKRFDDLARIIGHPEGALLLLAHDPRRIIEASELGVPAMLSGHTHGGQIVLPGLGAIAARKFPIAAGHLQRGPTALYVSRGVGTVILPIRINCPPEVNVVTLRGSAAGPQAT